MGATHRSGDPGNGSPLAYRTQTYCPARSGRGGCSGCGRARIIRSTRMAALSPMRAAILIRSRRRRIGVALMGLGHVLVHRDMARALRAAHVAGNSCADRGRSRPPGR